VIYGEIAVRRGRSRGIRSSGFPQPGRCSTPSLRCRRSWARGHRWIRACGSVRSFAGSFSSR